MFSGEFSLCVNKLGLTAKDFILFSCLSMQHDPFLIISLFLYLNAALSFFLPTCRFGSAAWCHGYSHLMRSFCLVLTNPKGTGGCIMHAF